MRKLVLCVAASAACVLSTMAVQGRPFTLENPDTSSSASYSGPAADSSESGVRAKAGKRKRYASLSGADAESSWSSGSRVTGVGPRPSKWCGWWMRTQLGGGPQYNVAWNWRHYGSPTSPQVGAVVVWRHHVGIITGQASNGQWIVKSGNDSRRVRERARSVAGAIFRI